MPSTAASIVSQIKTILAEIDGTGSYFTDISAGGQILIGKSDRVPTAGVAFVEIWIEETEAEALDVGATAFMERVQITIRGNVPATTLGTATETHMTAALDLIADIKTAVRLDLTLGGTAATSDIVDTQTFEGRDTDGIAWGGCMVSLSATYFTNATTTHGYRLARLAHCTYRADVDSDCDPSSELVTVTEVAGLWTVTIKRDTAITDAYLGVVFAFPMAAADGRPNTLADSILSWSTVVQVVTPPTFGSGMQVKSGWGDYNGGPTIRTRFAGISYDDATYPKARLHVRTTIATGNQTTQAAADRAFGGTMNKPQRTTAVTFAAIAVAAGTTDPRDNSSDVRATPDAVSGSGASSDGDPELGMIAVHSTGTGPQDSISFYVWNLPHREVRQ